MNKICILSSSYEYTIEDGYFRLHGEPTCVVYSVYKNIYNYIRPHLPPFVVLEFHQKSKEIDEELINTEINFKCKFGTKKIKLGHLFKLFTLTINDKEFLDWVAYFDVKYENAYEQYELSKLFGTSDFLRELIEQRFALKKPQVKVETKKIERIAVYTWYAVDGIVYVDKDGKVTESKMDNSYYLLDFKQVPRGVKPLEKMVRKVPCAAIGNTVSIDKLKSTNFLINWYIGNHNKPEYTKYSIFISEILIDCDLETMKKFVSVL